MCISIPMRVVELEGTTVWCEGRNGRARVDTLLVGAVSPGDWLLVYFGSAREIIDAERAAQVNAALDALDRIAAGQNDFDDCFADLTNGEPQLPEFLRQ
ncbi:MAG: HypC/HybG/HupF family hydrogenase formation chaperone [Methylobacillus sp.]|jgi:hydrogenase assembly chaperone HypC/HupF|nr:HypC/HybG/HupF family hydrogenase formation chaperone [Methylobacillus sp.]